MKARSSSTRVGSTCEALSVRDTARLLGWSYLRTLRWLLALDHAHDGRVLVNVRPGAKRPTYRIRKAMLMQVAPGLFAELESLTERVRTLEHDVEELREGQDLCARAIRSLATRKAA